MRALETMTGVSFRFKEVPGGEIIVYTSDKEGNPQDKSALVITPYESNLVKKAISQKDDILMGASMDAPPEGSLGWLLKQEGLTPRHLSYLIPILLDAGFCTCSKEKKAFIIRRRGGGN